MLTTIFVIVIVLTILYAVLSPIYGPKPEDKQQFMANVVDYKLRNIECFTPTKTIKGYKGAFCFAADDEHRKVAVITHNSATVIDYDNIYFSDIIEDGNTTHSRSMARTVGGAVVGGALMGGAGAVVGGLSGSTKEKKTVDVVQVLIHLHEGEDVIANCYNSKMKVLEHVRLDLQTTPGKSTYNLVMRHAQEIQQMIDDIVKNGTVIAEK